VNSKEKNKVEYCGDLMLKFMDAVEKLELGVFKLDKKSIIVKQNIISKRWFGDLSGVEYHEFCSRMLQDICSMDSMDVLAKNSKKYQITSFEIHQDGEKYTILVFKEVLNYFDYKYEIENDNGYILNRDDFIENTKSIMYEADIILSKVSLLFIEIKNLKKIINLHNRKSGEIVLDIVARRLKNSLRESDLIGKFDYNKFAVTIGGVEGSTIPKRISKKILHNVSRPVTIDDGEKITIDIVIGINIYPDDSQNIDRLIERADSAKYSMRIKSKRHFLFFI
jgi:diguanylate cyclase (GGDEF)-like protein